MHRRHPDRQQWAPLPKEGGAGGSKGACSRRPARVSACGHYAQPKAWAPHTSTTSGTCWPAAVADVRSAHGPLPGGSYFCGSNRPCGRKGSNHDANRPRGARALLRWLELVQLVPIPWRRGAAEQQRGGRSGRLHRGLYGGAGSFRVCERRGGCACAWEGGGRSAKSREQD